MQTPSPSMIQRWILAISTRTLPAALSPVVVGAGIGLSQGAFRILPVLAAGFAAVMIQIGTNLVNDVGDYLHGTDDENRLGPLRVTQAGLFTPKQVWMGVIVSFLLAGLAGIYLAWIGGFPVILIGSACILAGIAYTVGPYPLARHGYGDLFAFLFFGLIGVCGTVYILSGGLSSRAWLGGAGVGCLVTAILIVNNIRDIETDRRAGRSNIPIRFGRRGGEIEYALVLLIAFLIPLALIILDPKSIWTLLSWLALPEAIILFRQILRMPPGPGFNRLLAATARLCLHYSILFGAGFAISGFF